MFQKHKELIQRPAVSKELQSERETLLARLLHYNKGAIKCKCKWLCVSELKSKYYYRVLHFCPDFLADKFFTIFSDRPKAKKVTLKVVAMVTPETNQGLLLAGTCLTWSTE